MPAICLSQTRHKTIQYLPFKCVLLVQTIKVFEDNIKMMSSTSYPLFWKKPRRTDNSNCQIWLWNICWLTWSVRYFRNHFKGKLKGWIMTHSQRNDPVSPTWPRTLTCRAPSHLFSLARTVHTAPEHCQLLHLEPPLRNAPSPGTQGSQAQGRQLYLGFCILNTDVTEVDFLLGKINNWLGSWFPFPDSL